MKQDSLSGLCALWSAVRSLTQRVAPGYHGLMGTFRATIDIGDPAGQRWDQVDALVDGACPELVEGGSSYTWLPSDLLAQLGVAPQFQREFLTADGRIIERDLAVTLARWDGQTLPTLVVFGDEGSMPLLGAYTLEGFSLAADPLNRRLVPVRGLAM